MEASLREQIKEKKKNQEMWTISDFLCVKVIASHLRDHKLGKESIINYQNTK